MSRKSLINLIKEPPQDLNDNFLRHISNGIEYLYNKKGHKSTPTFKPSSLNCQRQMYYMRKGVEAIDDKATYSGIGVAQTGTDRHEDIQNILIELNETEGDWKYVDVETYVELQKAQGKCLDLEMDYKKGNECHFIDNRLHLSFMCDGILLYKPTGEYYLFEFKNQASMKARSKKCIDASHINQTLCYCLCFNLNKVVMLYEDRDICQLYCPPIVEYSQAQKDTMEKFLLDTEEMVRNNFLPLMSNNPSDCKWCKYKNQCQKDGG